MLRNSAKEINKTLYVHSINSFIRAMGKHCKEDSQASLSKYSRETGKHFTCPWLKSVWLAGWLVVCLFVWLFVFLFFCFTAYQPFRVIYIESNFKQISLVLVYILLNVKTMQLNVKTVLFQTIRFSVSTQFNSIWSIDRTLSDDTSLHKNV